MCRRSASGGGADRSSGKGQQREWRPGAAKYIKGDNPPNWGSSDVFVVLDDASLEKAVRLALRKAAAQQCRSVVHYGETFYLARKIADQFVSQFA